MFDYFLEFLFRGSELILVLIVGSEPICSVSFVANFDELQYVRGDPMILFLSS